LEDGTGIYWAGSRAVEYLSKIQPVLPEGVRTEMGPDATGVGGVFRYALVDDSGKPAFATHDRECYSWSAEPRAPLGRPTRRPR